MLRQRKGRVCGMSRPTEQPGEGWSPPGQRLCRRSRAARSGPPPRGAALRSGTERRTPPTAPELLLPCCAFPFSSLF